MRHCQPAGCAVDRVSGCSIAAALAGDGHRAVARQPSRPVLEARLHACSISRPRKPEQSMKRSPSTRAPSLERQALQQSRFRAFWRTSTMRPSVRTTPRLSAQTAQVARIERRHRTGMRSRCAKAANWAGPSAGARTGPASRRRRRANKRRAASESPERPALQPVMVEFDPQHVDSVEAKRMDVTMAQPRPVTNSMPSLYVALVARTKSRSSIPSIR